MSNNVSNTEIFSFINSSTKVDDSKRNKRTSAYEDESHSFRNIGGDLKFPFDSLALLEKFEFSFPIKACLAVSLT